MSKTLIQLFARPPVKGRVKTRLSADIGDDNALSIYLHCLNYCLDLIRHSGFDYQIWLSEVPPHWAQEDPIKIQQGNNLGDKMLSALRSELEREKKVYDRVILMGSDCIELSHTVLAKVNRKLDSHDLVIIPAEDGGYVLIAVRGHVHAQLFESIDWGTQRVLIQTLEKIMQSGINACILNPLRDIDRYADLQHYAAFNQYI
jgi:hypothetical protein